MSRIALVKPDRARAIEQLLMRMAQSGQLRGRVSEDQLIDVLDQVRPASRPLSPSCESSALTRTFLPSLSQVEAMEKGQSGGAQKSGSKITVRRSSCASRRRSAAAVELRRRRC